MRVRRPRPCFLLSLALAAACQLGGARAATAASLPEVPAWQKEVVYQIFPQSFADSDGDGVGDLRGITAKIDYLHALGVDVVWLTPIFPSTHLDSGYDVTDYLGIDPMYGTVADWNALRDGLHAKGMKIMLDLVLNHSSSEHPWYEQEKRLKVLQHSLVELVRGVGRSEGEAIVTLVGDPGAIDRGADDPKQPAPVAAAAQLLKTFAAEHRDISDAAAAAGYPTVPEQLAAFARALEPCAERHASCPDVGQPLDDFYLWREKPNNWISVFSGSAWHAVPGTGGYSMSLFSDHQIDLNWRNPRLRAAMGTVVSTWESRGVDGLRMDAIGVLGKDPTFPDAPAASPVVPGRGMQFFTNLPEVHRYLRELNHRYGPKFRSIGEVTFNRPDAPLQYAGARRGELNEIFVFDHMGADSDGVKWKVRPFDTHLFKKVIADQQNLIHGRAWLGNYVENHDQMRVVSRFADDGPRRLQSGKLFASLLLTLEGTPYIFQGQELGMTDLPVSTFKTVDDIADIEARNRYHAEVAAGVPAKIALHEVASRCRDHVRSAMQWRPSAHGGFTSGQPKVVVNGNYREINAESEAADPQSILSFYRRLIGLRREHLSWIVGDFVDLSPGHPSVFAYSRSRGDEKTLVLLNFAGKEAKVALPAAALPRAVSLTIGNDAPPPPPARDVTLSPYEARIYVGSPAAP